MFGSRVVYSRYRRVWGSVHGADVIHPIET